MPEMPISILQSGILIAALISAYLGFEVTSRAGRILGPIILLAIVIILSASSVGNLEWGRLLPLLGRGPEILLLQAPLMMSILVEIHILFLLQHKIVDVKNLMRYTLGVLIFTTITLTAAQAVIQAILPYPSIGNILFPLLELSRIISIGAFLQHMEAIFVFSWFFVQAFTQAITIYMVSYLWQYVWGIRDLRPLMPAVALLIYTGATVPENVLQLITLERILDRGVIGLTSFFIPLFFVSAATWRSRRKGGIGGGRLEEVRSDAPHRRVGLWLNRLLGS